MHIPDRYALKNIFFLEKILSILRTLVMKQAHNKELILCALKKDYGVL